MSTRRSRNTYLMGLLALLLLAGTDASAQWIALPSYPAERFTATTVVDGYLTEARNDGSSFKIRRWNGDDWEQIYPVIAKDGIPTPPESPSFSPESVVVRGDQYYVSGHTYYYDSVYMELDRADVGVPTTLDVHTCSDFPMGCASVGDLYLVDGEVYLGCGPREKDSLRRVDDNTLTELPPLDLWETDVPDCVDDSQYDWACSEAARVLGLASLGGVLYAAGDFVVSNGTPLSGFVRLEGDAWTSAGLELGGQVLALGEFEGKLVVAGDFPAPPGTQSSSIALFDGVTWTGLDEGITGTVYAVAEHQGQLYVGGEFSAAGGMAATNVAVWDGASWTSLPPLGDGRVRRLHSTNHGLMAIWRSLDDSLTLLYRLAGTVETVPTSWGGMKARFPRKSKH